MNVYKIELNFIDFDDIGEQEIKDLINNLQLPNHVIPPTVIKMECKDIGEWEDDNPLNNDDTIFEAHNKLFLCPTK